jgi:curved DNA-binding protein
VPTLGRPVRMKVPPTTANGCSFRLARLGMPRISSDGRGDLLVRVNALLPRQLSDRQRRLYEELQQVGDRQS